LSTSAPEQVVLPVEKPAVLLVEKQVVLLVEKQVVLPVETQVALLAVRLVEKQAQLVLLQ
jgi:hypothetical protein